MSSNSNRHIIRKQVLEVQISDRVQQNAISHLFQSAFQRRLLPLIQQQLDRLSPPNRLDRLERIEINLGEIPISKFEQVLEQKFKILFSEVLTKALHEAQHNSEFNTKINKTTFSQPFSQSEDPIPFNNKNNAAEQTVSSWALIKYFLETGLLPWWASQTDRMLLSKQLAELQLEPKMFWWPRLLKVLQYQVFQQRLFSEFTDIQLFTLLKNVWGQSIDTDLKNWSEWFSFLAILASEISISQSILRIKTWSFISSSLFSTSYVPSSFALNLKPLVKILSLESTNSTNLAILPQQSVLIKKAKTHFSTSNYNLVYEALQSLKSQDTIYPLGKGDHSYPTVPPKEFPHFPAFKQKTHDSINQLLKKEGVIIQNAGIVLVAPYFPRFFDLLEWLKDGNFVSETSQQTAVLMLHYLSFAEKESPEYLLALNKILCGIELAHPLAVSLPEEYLTPADQLLEAVIAQAPNLGLKTKEALRSSFLIREGILYDKGTNWLLHVERNAYDLLLGRLPWDFHILRLPWMEKPLFVEW